MKTMTIKNCSACGETHKKGLTIHIDETKRRFVNCPNTNKKVYIIQEKEIESKISKIK